MSAIVYGTPPRKAEEDADLLYRHRFPDKLSLTTTSGNPKVVRKLPCDGSSVNGTGSISSNLLNIDILTGRFRTSPAFAYDDSAAHTLIDSTSGESIKLQKTAANALVMSIDGSTILTSASGVFGAVWRTGESNLFEFAVDASGDNSLRLNGTEVATSATTWTAVAPTTLYFGSDNAGANYWSGDIEIVEFWSRACTLQEHIDAYLGQTWTYNNCATLICPMDSKRHDPTGSKTLDVSGNFNNLTLVSAVKTVYAGYTFDGSTSRFTGLPTLSGDYTVALASDDVVNFYNDSTVYSTLGTVGGFSGHVQGLSVYTRLLTTTQQYDCENDMIAAMVKP